MKEGGLWEFQWRLLERGIAPAAVVNKLAALREEHGDPARVCAFCARYMALPAMVRRAVESKIDRRETA